MKINEFDEAVLNSVKRNARSTPLYENEFQSMKKLQTRFLDNEEDLKNSLDKLVKKGYVKKVDAELSNGAYIRDAYELTDFGINYISRLPKNNFDNKKWFWWAMGIVGTVTGGLILFFVFGVGKK